MTTIKVKNKTNWFLTIFSSIGLLILTFIIVLILPLISIRETYLLSAISYIALVIPFLAFYILFIYIWLWNTFGKTILKFDTEKIILIKKNKLFSKSKTYYRAKIQSINIEDFKIEKTQFNTRYHIFSNSTFSVTFIYNNLTIRIIDWLTHEKAKEIKDILS